MGSKLESYIRKMMNNSIASLSLLLLWFFSGSGCSVSKQDRSLKDVALEPPSLWSVQDHNFSVSSEERERYWLESFDDQLLNEAVYTAWSSNPELAAKAEQTLARGEEAVILGANPFPQANLGINASRSKRNLIGFNFPNGSTSFTSKSFSSGFNVSWELDLWGKSKSLRNSAQKKFESAQVEFEASRLSVAGQVAKTWYSIAESELQLALARRMTETFEKNHLFISNRFANGLASSLEDDLASSALASSRAMELVRVRARDKLSKELDALLGYYPQAGGDRNFSKDLPDLGPRPFPPPPAQALAERPDVQIAELLLESSGYELTAAKMSLLPSVSLGGGPGSRSEEFEDLLDRRFRTWEISGGISQPIFNAGKLRANVRRAEAIRKSAEANYRATALLAFTEIETLLANEEFLSQESIYLKKAAEAAESAARASWDRYQRGVLGIFDTLESQRRTFEAKSRLLTLGKERIFNRIHLYLSLGMPALPTEP